MPPKAGRSRQSERGHCRCRLDHEFAWKGNGAAGTSGCCLRDGFRLYRADVLNLLCAGTLRIVRLACAAYTVPRRGDEVARHFGLPAGSSGRPRPRHRSGACCAAFGPCGHDVRCHPGPRSRSRLAALDGLQSTLLKCRTSDDHHGSAAYWCGSRSVSQRRYTTVQLWAVAAKRPRSRPKLASASGGAFWRAITTLWRA